MIDDQTRHVAVDELIPCVHQSRTVFDEAELRNLSEDIKANGLLQPGVAWFDPGRGKYVLLCGERRWRAIKMAGLPTMAVKVIQGNPTQGEMLAINLSENLQRASLNPIERAAAFQRLAQLENLTSTQVAERTHVSIATVSRDLAMLTLPEILLRQIADGTLAVSVAYELSKIGNAEAQLEMARAFSAGLKTRDEVAAAVRSLLNKPPKAAPANGRISCRLDGGISITVTRAGQTLTKADLLRAIEYLRKETTKLKDGGEAPDLAKAS